jgi:hypothetical protein
MTRNAAGIDLCTRTGSIHTVYLPVSTSRSLLVCVPDLVISVTYLYRLIGLVWTDRTKVVADR